MVVLLDFSSGVSGELSVRCGQTVELVERSAERPGWCLARTTDQTPQQVTEGFRCEGPGLTRFLDDLEDMQKNWNFFTSNLIQMIGFKLVKKMSF